MTDRPVTLAAITGAHGVAGEVRLKLFGEGVAGLKRYKAFHADGDAARALTVVSLRDDGPKNKRGGGAIARFAEVGDRTAAEALRGVALSVPRSSLPPLAKGEYYYADLVGLPAVSVGGVALGVVVAVENFGAGDIIEIERPDKKRFMVPMKADAVPAWDAARLVVAEGWAQG